MRKTIDILNIPFATLQKQEILAKLHDFLHSRRQHHIATPNPEFLLESLKNEKFKKILQNTSINIPDGMGILWAATIQCEIQMKCRDEINRISTLCKLYKYFIGIKYLIAILVYPRAIKKIIPERITGTDLMGDVFEKFPDKKFFLLGAKEGVAEKVIKNLTLKTKNQKLKTKNYCGSPKTEDEEEILNRINDFKPEILFVAFGSPKQEFWINKNLQKIPSVTIAIGVGGAFDFFAGKKKRAPKIFQKLGIEWMFRLIIEPKRWKRIFNAVIIFPWKFLKSL